MFIKIIGVLAIISLSGCATSGEGGSWSKNHSFSLNNGSEFSFRTSGCGIAGGSLRNGSGKNVSAALGTLIVTNSNNNNTIDEYMIICPATLEGGASSCKISRRSGRSDFTDYGGIGCPDMNFNLIKFNMF